MPLSASFRLLRFAFTILGAAFGLFGLQFALLLTIIHLCSLRPFGIPLSQPAGAADLTRSVKTPFITVWLVGNAQPSRSCSVDVSRCVSHPVRNHSPDQAPKNHAKKGR